MAGTKVRSTRRRSSHRSEVVQGKPVARRGRKARDLRREAARPPREECDAPGLGKGKSVKAILARFTWAVMVLGAMALTVGAGIKWS